MCEDNFCGSISNSSYATICLSTIRDVLVAIDNNENFSHHSKFSRPIKVKLMPGNGRHIASRVT